MKVITTLVNSEVGKFIETENRLMAAYGKQGVGSDYQGSEVSFWDNENALKLGYGNGCRTL